MIEYPITLLSALFLSGFWPLIFTVAFTITCIIVTASELITVSYVALVVYLLALSLFTSINPFAFIIHNPTETLQFLLGYFLVGTLYSAVKYRSFVASAVEKIEQIKVKFISKFALAIKLTEEIPGEYRKDWKDFFSSENYTFYNKVHSGLSPLKQKTLICNWIAFWPFSAVGLLIADPLRDFVIWLYNRMGKVYTHLYYKLVTSKINVKDLDI